MIELYVLDTGLIESTDYSIWSPSAEPGSHEEMTVRSYLVVHPKGATLARPRHAFRPVPTRVPPGHRPGRAPRVDRDLRRRRARRERGERAPVTRQTREFPAPAAGDSLAHAASPVE